MSLLCKVLEIDKKGKRVLLSDDSVFGGNIMRTAYRVMGYGVAFDKRNYDNLVPGLEEGTAEGAIKVAQHLARHLPEIRITP